MRESLAAEVTDVAGVATVLPLVFPQVPGVAETRATGAALVRFLSGVDQLVTLEIRNLEKTSPTRGADEGFVAAVCRLLVFTEGAGRLIRLVAHVAVIRLVPHVPAHVHGHVVEAVKPLVTVLTPVRVPGMTALVKHQRRPVFQHLVTHSALVLLPETLLMFLNTISVWVFTGTSIVPVAVSGTVFCCRELVAAALALEQSRLLHHTHPNSCSVL